MMDELVGDFTGDLAYYELLSLSPELASNVTSPPGLAGNLGVASGPSIGSERFEFILPLPMAASVAVSEAAVLVSALAAWAAPELASKAGHPALSVRMLGENTGASG